MGCIIRDKAQDGYNPSLYKLDIGNSRDGAGGIKRINLTNLRSPVSKGICNEVPSHIGERNPRVVYENLRVGMPF